MAILKKPEPKQRKCKCAPPSLGLSALMSAARTLAPSPEEIARREQMSRMQLATMSADLRMREAQADLAETNAARARLDYQDHLDNRANRKARK